MANDPPPNRPPRWQGLASAGGRAAAIGLKPLTGAVGAAAEAGINLERRAFDRFIDSGELERLLASDRLQTAIEHVLTSDGANRLIDAFFDSGLFDRFVDRLLASDGLWRLVDEIAGSPSVRAAISQQGLGFADQVGGEVRARSRKADDWLERVAHRLSRRKEQVQAARDSQPPKPQAKEAHVSTADGTGSADQD